MAERLRLETLDRVKEGDCIIFELEACDV